MSEVLEGPETPAAFKQALRDATRVEGFDHLIDLAGKTGLSRATVSMAFSITQPMPSDSTITAIVQAMRGDVEIWLARSRRIDDTPTFSDEPVEPEIADGISPGDQSPATDTGTSDTTREPMAPAHETDPETSADESSPKTTRTRAGALLGSEDRRRRRLLLGVIIGTAIVLLLVVVITVTLLLRTDNAPPERTIIVQNKVATGATDLVEDDSPSYLAARPIARCANVPGCKLTGTNLRTGDAIEAVCQLQGALLTNANVDSPGIKTNPNAAASALWYGIKWRDGRRGFLNEVYIAPSYRGGLGLPGC